MPFLYQLEKIDYFLNKNCYKPGRKGTGFVEYVLEL